MSFANIPMAVQESRRKPYSPAVLPATSRLTCYLTDTSTGTSFHRQSPGAAATAARTGLLPIELMLVINFVIARDFRRVIFPFTVPWLISPWLYSKGFG